jgi:hypothetical protein
MDMWRGYHARVDERVEPLPHELRALEADKGAAGGGSECQKEGGPVHCCSNPVTSMLFCYVRRDKREGRRN